MKKLLLIIAIFGVISGFAQTASGDNKETLSIKAVEDNNKEVTAIIFPNFATELLQLYVDKYEGMACQLTDDTGKLLENKTLVDKVTKVDVRSYSTGTYTLTLMDMGKNKVKSFEITKL